MSIKSWESLNLEELCTIKTGDKDANEGNVNGKYPFFTCAQDISYSDDYSFDGQSILIAGNGNFNVKKFDGKFEAYQRTYVLQDLKVDFRYLYYYILGKLPEITKGNRGSTIRYIRIGDIANYPVPFPSFSEQNRIVDKIETLFSEVDAGIANLTLAKRQLEQYRQSLLKHAFEGKLTAKWREEYTEKHGKTLPSADELLEQIQTARQDYYDQQMVDWEQAVKLWENESKEDRKPSKSKIIEVTLSVLGDELFKYQMPSEWSVIHLGNVLIDISAGKSFKCEEREPRDGEIGVAKISALTWGEYDESESKTCTNEDLINENLFIKNNDFLLSRANTIDLVGNCVIVSHTQKNIMLSDKTLRIDFLLDFISKKYVLYYLRSGFGRREIMERSTGNQESMRNISQKSINRINIPICSREEQIVIVELLENKLSNLKILESEIENSVKKANLLKTSILHKAFQGKLVPQDPNDPPASELLAQIKAEREAKALAEKQAKQDKAASKSKAKAKSAKTPKKSKKDEQITLPLQ